MNSDGTSRGDPRGENQPKLAVLDQDPQYLDRKGRVGMKYDSRDPAFKTLESKMKLQCNRIFQLMDPISKKQNLYGYFF